MLKDKKSIIIGIITLVLAVGITMFGVNASGKLSSVTINNVENLTMNVEGSVDELGEMLGASGTRFPHGISADSTSPLAGEVRGTTLTVTGATTIGGLTTLNAGQLRSYTNATSTTATSQTLEEADLLNYDTVLLTPDTPSLTLTLPATSTLTSFIPTAGDMAEQCWYNATSTASMNITFAAGTGIDLQTASTTQTDLTFATGGNACLKFIRQTDTDVSVLMTEYTDAD